MGPAQNRSQWESRPRTLAMVLLVLFVVLLGLGYLAYRFGAPLAADAIAAAAPERLVTAVLADILGRLEQDARGRRKGPAPAARLSRFASRHRRADGLFARRRGD